jgi:hypothetical protein
MNIREADLQIRTIREDRGVICAGQTDADVRST